MRKLLFLIFLLCLTATFAAAQKTVRKRPKNLPLSTAAENQTASDSNNQPASPKTSQKPVNSNNLDTPLKILEKPRPSLFPDGQNCSQGKVVLRVTFPAAGEVGTITVISGLTRSKTAASIEAAKKIKFIPATKSGMPVNTTKPVEYVFSIY